jgi:membrane fusion protein (multidrug efflux system)
MFKLNVLRPTFFIYSGFFISASFLLTACSEQQAPAARPSVVEIITVQSKDTPITYEFVGRTVSSQQVEIRSRVDGFLDHRLYKEGSMVQQGDVMFQIDAKPFEAQLAAAKAALAQQLARLQTFQANLKRVKPLAKANAVSEKELDDSQGSVNSAAAAVAMAKAELDTAKLNLGYTTIYAPVTGASSYARIQDGAYVNELNSLLTYVAQLDPIWVDFNVSENEMLKVRTMKKKGLIKVPENGRYEVVLILSDGSTYPETGLIFFADANYSTETGTFLIRASFQNPTKQLRPGQFVRVLLKGAIQLNAVLVPQKAVSQGAAGFFLWVVDKNNTAQIRNIEVGDWRGDSWFVTDGLKNGDRVITSGFITLSSDKPVTIKSATKKADSTKTADTKTNGSTQP